MRLIDADKLQKLFNSTSSALLSDVELSKDIEHVVRAFLMVAEMISDAPTERNAIPVEWIKRWEVWGKDSIERGRYLGAVSAMLWDWDNEVDIDKQLR